TERGLACFTSHLTFISQLPASGENVLVCEVKWRHVSLRGDLHLEIQYAPRLLLISGEDRSSDSVREGSGAALRCSVRSLPASNLTWIRNGAILNSSKHSNELWLLLPALTYQHAGEYRCNASNKHGTATTTTNITLEYSPKEVAVKVSGWRHGIREGDNITLSCFCRSNPPPTNYSWFRVGVDNGTEFVTSSVSLPLGTVTRGQDNVGYYCRAENALGANHSALWQINVEYGAEVMAQSKCTGTAEVECVCVVTGNPAAKISWVLEDRVIGEDHAGSGVKVATEVRGHEARSILTVKRSHEEFKAACVGSNRHGDTRLNFRLYDKGWMELLWIGLIGGLCGAFVAAAITGTTCWLVGARRKVTTQVTLSPQERPPSDRDSSQTQVIQDTVSESHTYQHLPATSRNTEQVPSENILYCNINYSKLPVSDGTVWSSETTDYAIIQLSPHQPPA
ncbi:myelin-associated glycoprotein-like, partial [Mustelus asterias]